MDAYGDVASALLKAALPLIANTIKDFAQDYSSSIQEIEPPEWLLKTSLITPVEIMVEYMRFLLDPASTVAA